MALVISDRIKETTNTVGTQTFQLEGAVTGFETFAANLSDGDTTYYAVTDNTNFEVGLGTIDEGTSQTINYTVTVVSDGGNKFALNGVTNPVITFVKGFTYVFDVSDSTNGSHPLRFRTSADASYTDGVSVSGTQGQANATVTIVVASDAPSTLKYYCTAHGNAMGNTINVISAVATLARTTILASSNSNNAVSFGSGAKTIFCTLPADKTVFLDGSDDLTLVGASGNIVFDKSDDALEFADNIYAKFGTGGDLTIRHESSGNHSVIRESGSGNLYIDASHLFLRTSQSDGFEALASFTANGAVELYYDNSKKFQTDTSGITVTGRIEATSHINLNNSNGYGRVEIGGSDGAFIDLKSPFSDDFDHRIITAGSGAPTLQVQSDDLHFLNRTGTEFYLDATANGAVNLYYDNVKKFETTSDGATVTGDLLIESTDAGAGDNPTLDLYRNSSSPAANDLMGQIVFSGEDAGGNKTNYAEIESVITDTTDGSEDGLLRLRATINGSMTTYYNAGYGANFFYKNVALHTGVDLSFEGATNNNFETTLTVVDPTQDNTITLPDSTGTVLTTGNSDTPTTTTSSSDADFVLVDDGGTMKKITPTNLGITAGAASLDDATALAIALG